MTGNGAPSVGQVLSLKVPKEQEHAKQLECPIQLIKRGAWNQL